MLRLIVLVAVAAVAVARENCGDLYADGIKQSGEYEFNKDGVIFKAYCEFRGNSGFQYFPIDAYTAESDKIFGVLNIDDVFEDVSKFNIRIKEGEQTSTVIENLDNFAEYSITAVLNSNGGMNGPVNKFPSYVYFGLLPRTIAGQRIQQGFKSNGKALTFKNCDANPNAYFAFYPNLENNPGNTRNVNYALMNNWINSKIVSGDILSDRYFMDLEAHFGGCGAYMWNKNWRPSAKFAPGFAFGPLEEPSPECVETSENFVEEYGHDMGITAPELDEDCDLLEKQCGDELCCCLKTKNGSPRFCNTRDQPLDCEAKKAKGCLKKRSAALMDGDSYLPQCQTDNNRLFVAKQCEDGECWCVKKKGKVIKKIARGPADTVVC